LFEVQSPEWIRMDLDTLFDDLAETEFNIENINRIRDIEHQIETGLDLLVILNRSNSINPADKLMYEAYIMTKRKEMEHIRQQLISISK